MVVSEIKLYELLKAKIRVQEAEAFIEILDTRVDKAAVSATQEDFAKLEAKIVEYKVDIIKWMIATAVALYGILMASMKFFFHL